jgi:hypothetical protein
MEVALFLRGRDHYYVLRFTPLRAADGAPAGLILGLQDVTYLRDQEARREHCLGAAALPSIGRFPADQQRSRPGDVRQGRAA